MSESAFTYFSGIVRDSKSLPQTYMGDRSYVHPTEGVINFYQNPIHYAYRVVDVDLNSQKQHHRTELFENLANLIGRGTDTNQSDPTSYPGWQAGQV